MKILNIANIDISIVFFGLASVSQATFQRQINVVSALWIVDLTLKMKQSSHR